MTIKERRILAGIRRFCWVKLMGVENIAGRDGGAGGGREVRRDGSASSI